MPRQKGVGLWRQGAGGRQQKRSESGILRFSWACFPILRQAPVTTGGRSGKPEGLVIHQRQSGRANRLINHCCRDGWRPITDHGKHYACSVGREDQSRVSGGPQQCEPAGATRSQASSAAVIRSARGFICRCCQDGYNRPCRPASSPGNKPSDCWTPSINPSVRRRRSCPPTLPTSASSSSVFASSTGRATRLSRSAPWIRHDPRRGGGHGR